MHGTYAIPDGIPPQMPLPKSYMDEIMQNLTLSMAQHFQLPGGQNARSIFPRVQAVERVSEARPAKYRGSKGPEAADEWVNDFGDMFEAMGCTDAKWVGLAEYNLQGEVGHWWKAIKRACSNAVGVTWEEFSRIFLNKYFPFIVKERKALEFEWLIQGTMTVVEYEGRLVVLSKYTAYLVQDPVKRARRFERELNPEIRRYLALLRLEDYDEIYHMTQIIERTFGEIEGYHVT